MISASNKKREFIRRKIYIKNKLIIITILLTMISAIMVVNASNLNDRINRAEIIPNIYFQSLNPSEGRNWGTQARFLRRASDNQIVYCIQVGVPVDSNVLYSAASSNQWTYLDYINEAQWERISLLAYYGYGYEDHNEAKWYAITQYLIHRTIAEPMGWTIHFTNGLWGSIITPFQEEIAQLERLVSNHNIKPSFNNDNLTLKLGEEVTIIDTNEVLENFTIINNEKLTIVQNGNELTITANKAGEVTLEFKRSDTRFSTTPIVYFHPESQDVKSVGSFRPVRASLNIKTERLGQLEIIKYGQEVLIADGSFQYSDIRLPGVNFNIYANEDIYFANRLIHTKDSLVGSVITNENGWAKLDSLYLGKYYLIETETNEHHLLNSEQIYFELNDNRLEVLKEISNEHKRGSLEFIKTDINQNPIPNTVISLYTAAGDLIFTGSTNELGKIEITDLFVGSFYLVEKVAAEGFILNPEQIWFEISQHDEVVIITMINEMISVPDTYLSESLTYKNIAYLMIISSILYFLYDQRKRITFLKKKSLVVSSLFFLIGLGVIMLNVYSNYQFETQQQNSINEFLEINMATELDLWEIETEYVAVIEIPSINLKRGIVNPYSLSNTVDQNIQVLKPYQFPDMEGGNFKLAAHSGSARTAFFRNLINAELGDIVYIHYGGKRYDYKIINIYNEPRTGLITVNRNQENTILTLTTCNNSDPNNEQQLIVVAKLTNKKGFS